MEVFWEGDGVFYRGTIMGYSINSNKHVVLYDDGESEKVDLSKVPHRWGRVRGQEQGAGCECGCSVCHWAVGWSCRL